MKFIETKREELRRERIALNEQEWEELRDLLLGAGQCIYRETWWDKASYLSLGYSNGQWWGSRERPTITLAELKAKYFEPETREPKIGDWGYFWDSPDSRFSTLAKLGEIRSGRFYLSGLKHCFYNNFSHTIPPHIQELMKEPQYEVVHSFGESSGQIVVEKEIAPGLYAGTRGGVNVVLKRITP